MYLDFILLLFMLLCNALNANAQFLFYNYSNNKVNFIKKFSILFKKEVQLPSAEIYKNARAYYILIQTTSNLT